MNAARAARLRGTAATAVCGASLAFELASNGRPFFAAASGVAFGIAITLTIIMWRGRHLEPPA